MKERVEGRKGGHKERMEEKKGKKGRHVYRNVRLKKQGKTEGRGKEKERARIATRKRGEGRHIQDSFVSGNPI